MNGADRKPAGTPFSRSGPVDPRIHERSLVATSFGRGPPAQPVAKHLGRRRGLAILPHQQVITQLGSDHLLERPHQGTRRERLVHQVLPAEGDTEAIARRLDDQLVLNALGT